MRLMLKLAVLVLLAGAIGWAMSSRGGRKIYLAGYRAYYEMTGNRVEAERALEEYQKIRVSETGEPLNPVEDLRAVNDGHSLPTRATAAGSR